MAGSGEGWRSWALVALITVLLFVAIELGVRVLTPQAVTTTYLQGGPLGLNDPVLGHTNRPDTHAHVSAPEYDVEYIVDHRGFRAGSAQVDPPQGQGEMTILLLGDSFTFGAANSFAEIWPTLLAARFEAEGRQVEIVNAGVPGYNTTQQALYLERIFEDYAPDVILLTFLPNDLFANEPARLDGDLEVAGRDASSVVGGAGNKGSSLESVVLLKRALMAVDRSYISLYAMTPRRQFFEAPKTELVAQKYAATEAALSRMAGFAAERDADLVVISLPQLFQVLSGASRTGDAAIDTGLPDAELAPFAEGQGVAWVSMLGALVTAYREGGEDIYHRFDGHLNARGNALVADLIYEEVFSQTGVRRAMEASAPRSQ